VGGIGKVTERVLQEVLEVGEVKGLFEKRAQVLHVFTPSLAAFLFRVGLGVHHEDERAVRNLSLKTMKSKKTKKKKMMMMMMKEKNQGGRKAVCWQR
jgi:hypothetical protein